MNTLKGVFGDTKPKHRRNFIQENMKQLREMQGYWQSKDKEPNSGVSRPTNKYQNVPSRLGQRTHNEQLPPKNKTPGMRASKSRTLTSTASNPVSHVTQVGVKQRSQSPPQRRNVNKKKEPREKEYGDDISPSEVSPISNVEGSTNRSLGCQTVDPKNAEDLYNEGVIKYPSSRKSPPPKKRLPVKRPPTQEMGLQTEDSQSPQIKNTAAGGDTPRSADNGEPDLQKLSISQHSTDDDEPTEVPQVKYEKTNTKLIKPIIRSPVTNPLRPPPSYKKGVVPKYLQERKEEWQKEAEQQIRDAPDPNCPPGHVSLPDNERIETLKMLRKSYAELVHELNMMPVRTDTLRNRNRKMELEKQLNKIEQGIKVFSRPKVYVQIGA